MSDDIPRWVRTDERLVEYRELPFPEAFQRVLALWRLAPALFRGPGPLGTTEVPLENVLAEWLLYEHPESERLLYEHLGDESVYVRAYCLHTLVAMGSRLLLTLPTSVTECSQVITRCHGCSVVQVPFWVLFDEEVQCVRKMFTGDRGEMSSGWWRRDE